MKKLCLLTFIVLLFASCDRYLNTSILIPLSIENLSKAIKKDSTFAELYVDLRDICDSKRMSDITKAKFQTITYKDVLSFKSFDNDSNYFRPLSNKWEQEWKNKYDKYDTKIDSIIQYWKEYKLANSLDNYVDIKLAKIDKEYYTYSGDIKNVNFGFELTPKKGKIDELVFSYYIKAKIDDDKSDSFVSVLDKHTCRLSSPFSSVVTRYWEVGYSDEAILKDHTLSSFNRDYNIHINIEEIRINGINKTEDDLDIPESVKKYMKNYTRFPDIHNTYFADDVAKEFLDKDYLHKSKYIDREKNEVLKKKFPLVYELMEEKDYYNLFQYELSKI